MKFDNIELTSSRKVPRNYKINKVKCGLAEARHWKTFDRSLLESDPLYFYVGAGLSMSAGLVGWWEMACVVWRYIKYYEAVDMKLPANTAEDNANFLDRFVNESVKRRGRKPYPFLSRDNDDPRVLGRVALLNMLLRYRKPKTVLERGDLVMPPDEEGHTRYGQAPIAEDLVLHSLIWRTNCHGVLTPNYDMLLEHAFSLFDHGAALRSYRYDADFLKYIMSNRQFVLKLHGDINDIRSMLFNPQSAWKKGTKYNPPGKLAGPLGEDLKMVYQTALKRGHMVYVGTSFSDRTIFELHGHRHNNSVDTPRIRVALIPEGGIKSIKDRNNRFKDIIFLTYKGGKEKRSPNDEEPSHVVREFLSRIVHVRNNLKYKKRGTCLETTDIHSQIFLSEPNEGAKQLWQTDPWTCESKKL